MLLTELNTDVLSHIFGYLDLIDSINLAETCTRLRDVGQLYYKRFETFSLEHYLRVFRYHKRHNRVDATIVLKHIGPLIRNLAVDLDVMKIGSDVCTSIRKHCVNVKTLKIFERFFVQPYNPYTAYSEWLRKLNLTKISLPIQDLFLIDLSLTTTLEELHIDFYGNEYPVDYGRVADIFEKNCNISCLRIPLIDGFQYEIFEKLKCVRRLVLDIEYDKGVGHFEKLAANLKMTALEKLELNIGSWLHRARHRVDELNEFLKRLSENALHLKDLSIDGCFLACDTNALLSIQLLKLTSLRVMIRDPSLCKEISKIQPNLTHLDLTISNRDMKPMEQIIILINNLEKLELLRIRNLYGLQSVLKDFLQESVLCRIFDFRSNNRSTVILQLFGLLELQVELDFKARKWMFNENYYSDLVERQSTLPLNYTTVETIQRFSGSVTDLNLVKDEAIKWIEGLSKLTLEE